MRLFLLCLILPLAALSQPVPSTITEVTLFADRALVTREAPMNLAEEVVSVEIPGLPAWVDTASVRARLLPSGEVLDVRSRREFLARTPDEDLRAAEDAVRDITDRIAAIEDERKALEEKKQQITAIRTFASAQLPPEVHRRDIPVAYFREIAEYVHQTQVEIDASRRALEQQARELRPELESRRRRLAELQRGNRLEQLHLSFTLRPDGAGDHTMVLQYELPGATWEATHDVRVSGGEQVSLVSFARVRQTTGEDWDNARFSFSTRRPGQQVRIPQLESLLLGSRAAVNPVAFQPGSVSSWKSAQDAYAGDAFAFNLHLNDGRLERARLEDNRARQISLQTRSEVTFDKLEARGTTALFEAEGRFTVRSDGNEVRIPYARSAQTGKLTILAAPEISANAARGIELTHRHELPLLPGDAALFLDGAFIGNTSLDFAGPGESFVLFAGTEDTLKVTRVLNRQESELRRGRRSNRMVVVYTLTAENTGDRPLPIRLADRVPVTDDRDIRVEQVRIEPSVAPDEQGLFFWEVVVPPTSSKTFHLRYVVNYPPGLRVQPRAVTVPAAPGAANPFGGSGAALEAPAAASPFDLNGTVEQILQLERLF